MIKKFLTVFVLLILSACGGNQYITHSVEAHEVRTIHWRHYSPAVVRTGISLDKPVLLYFEAEDCLPCEFMQNTTLKNPKVALFINENYLPIKINEKHDDLIDKYNVIIFPSIVLLSSSHGKKYGKLDGAYDSLHLLSWLKMGLKVNTLLKGEGSILEELIKVGD